MPKVNDIVYLKNSHEWIKMLREYTDVLPENIEFADCCEALFEKGQERVLGRIIVSYYGEDFTDESHYSVLVDVGRGLEAVDASGEDLEAAPLEPFDSIPETTEGWIGPDLRLHRIIGVLEEADASVTWMGATKLQRDLWNESLAKRILDAIDGEVVQ